MPDFTGGLILIVHRIKKSGKNRPPPLKLPRCSSRGAKQAATDSPRLVLDDHPDPCDIQNLHKIRGARLMINPVLQLAKSGVHQKLCDELGTPESFKPLKASGTNVEELKYRATVDTTVALIARLVGEDMNKP